MIASENLCLFRKCDTLLSYERTIMSDKQTFCYTYQVSMVIQILAESEEDAKKQLDNKGGYVSDRQVNLMDSVPLYSGQNE